MGSLCLHCPTTAWKFSTYLIGIWWRLLSIGNTAEVNLGILHFFKTRNSLREIISISIKPNNLVCILFCWRTWYEKKYKEIYRIYYKEIFVKYIQEHHLNQEILGLQLGPKNGWYEKTKLMRSLTLKKNEKEEYVVLYSKKQKNSLVWNMNQKPQFSEMKYLKKIFYRPSSRLVPTVTHVIGRTAQDKCLIVNSHSSRKD